MSETIVQETASSMNDSIKPWQSKTLWINVVVSLAAVIAPVAHTWIAAHPEFFAAGFGLVNFVLRLITKDKIQLS